MLEGGNRLFVLFCFVFLSFFESKHLFLQGAYSPRETGLPGLHSEDISLCRKIQKDTKSGYV